VQAALPTWLAGPTALGSPVPWIVPATLTVLFGGGGGLRTLAMLVGYALLRRLFRAGLGRVTGLTATWAVALLLIWLSFVRVASGVSYAAEDADASVDVTVPTALSTQRSDAFSMVEVDRPPYLENQDELDAAIDAVVSPPGSLQPPDSPPSPASEQSVVLHFVVNADGSVDRQTVTVTSAVDMRIAAIAVYLPRVLRFTPALKDG